MCAGLFILGDRDIISVCMILATYSWSFMPRLLQSQFSTKCSALSFWHAVAHFATRVKDGDNHSSFVCFTCLPIFKGQCLKMSRCEDRHAISTTENRGNAVEFDLYCTCGVIKEHQALFAYKPLKGCE